MPLEKASKPWKICVSFPHMKDAYWLGVDYGVIEEAKRLGVALNVVEAGGYTELNKQISQIEDCVANGAQAVIIGAISADGLNNLVKEIAARRIPVIDVINGINSPDISAKSLVSFYTMGQSTGQYLAKKHPAGSGKVKVGWFPGPAGAGWVEAANKGFLDAVKGTDVEVLDAEIWRHRQGGAAQARRGRAAGQSRHQIYCRHGGHRRGVCGLLRERGLTDQIGLLAFYMTPGVYRGHRSRLHHRRAGRIRWSSRAVSPSTRR